MEPERTDDRPRDRKNPARTDAERMIDAVRKQTLERRRTARSAGDPRQRLPGSRPRGHRTDPVHADGFTAEAQPQHCSVPAAPKPGAGCCCSPVDEKAADP